MLKRRNSVRRSANLNWLSIERTQQCATRWKPVQSLSLELRISCSTSWATSAFGLRK